MVPILQRELPGLSILGTRVKKPVVLRATAPIAGRVEAVRRLAQCVIFELDEARLAISPMLAGRFQLARPEERDPADLAVAFTLSDGRELRYRDDVSMGKVYLLPAGGAVPGLEVVGVDVLGPDFDRERFRALCRARRDQAKVFLMDKSALDAMGNAYADEVLWEAGVHPKRTVRSLSPEEQDRLHDAIVSVLTHARDHIRERNPPLDVKLRDFLHVRGRAGEACDRCGTKLRTTGVHGHDAFFCPRCQPDTQARGFVDWRKVPGA